MRAAVVIGLGLPAFAAAGVWLLQSPRGQAPAPAPSVRIVAPLPPDGALVAWAESEAAPPLARRAAGPAPSPAPLHPAPGVRIALAPEAPTLGLSPDLPLRALATARPPVPAAPAVPETAPRIAAAEPGPEPEPEPEMTRGLRRSPLPQARPARILALAAAPVPQPETRIAAHLPPPPARPAAVARLASLPAATAPLVATPQPTPAAPAAIEVPPLTETASAGCGPQLTRAIPRRPSGAEGGRAAMGRLAGSGGTGRDAAIVRAVESGNIPDHLRRLVPVTMAGTAGDGRRVQITLCVMPDYLAVGSDRDFVRVPLGLPAANRLAQRFDMLLPTARMVDAIHAQARLRLRPSPMTPGAQMASTDYFLRHNATVEAQRASTGAALGVLVSGHKKDLVISNRLTRVAGRVAIYGWHQANGRPIQPLSTVHGQNYADYSHGIRLVSRTAWLNGRQVDLRDLLADRRFAAILSGDEGPIASGVILAALR